MSFQPYHHRCNISPMLCAVVGRMASHWHHPHWLCLFFVLIALSAPLPSSAHSKHQSSASSIHELSPFLRFTRLHHGHIHSHRQTSWPGGAVRSGHRSHRSQSTPNSSHHQNAKRFSAEKSNANRQQARAQDVKSSKTSADTTPIWDQRGAGQHSENISHLLDHLLLGYDSHVRPDFGGPPIEVLIDFHIRSMGPISEMDMTYTLNFYFRQTWTDHRLAYKSIPIFQSFSNKNIPTSDTHNLKTAALQNTSQKALALSIYMLDRIWKPPTYFLNSRQSHMHMITLPNKFVRIYSNGRVLYSSRMTIKANCPMNLENFPMDTQRCPLTLGSFGYTSKDLIYNWNPNRKVVINPDMKMSQFDLIGVPVHSYNSSMLTSSMQQSYSVLVATFHFKRHMGSFVIEVYAPCVMLTVLSWVGFWINREATADRVTLGLTTVLTMTFLGLELRNDLPKVPYLTALDYFVYISFAFISATILEFGFVHFFTKIGSGEYYFMPVQEFSHDEVRYSGRKRSVLTKRIDGGTMSRSVDQIASNWSPVQVKRSASWSMSPRYDETDEDDEQEMDNRPPSIRRVNAQSRGAVQLEYRPIVTDSIMYHSNRLTAFRTSLRNRLRHSFRQRPAAAHRRPGVARNSTGNVQSETSVRVQLNSVSQIDRASRVIFPLAFLGMNFIYWFIYLRAERGIDMLQFKVTT